MTSLIPAVATALHDRCMSEPVCLLCERDSEAVPLISLLYQRRNIHVCPQHLPVLIHDPGQLVGLLQGAETFRPADIHD
jgi:hypothetical protein